VVKIASIDPIEAMIQPIALAGRLATSNAPTTAKAPNPTSIITPSTLSPSEDLLQGSMLNLKN
jgi:hypothetical protein